MVDEVITKQELIDAQKDAQSLEDVVNGEPGKLIRTRLGREVYTLASVPQINTMTREEITAAVTPKADRSDVNTALSNLSTNANKYYATLAAANADIANIAINQSVTIGESGANGGLWYKATAGTTSLTKSPYDPLIQAKEDATTKANAAEVNAKSFTESIIKEKNLFNGVYAENYITGTNDATLALAPGNTNSPNARTAHIYVKPNTTYIVRKTEQTDMFRIALFKSKFGNGPVRSRYILNDTQNTGTFEFTTASDERLLAITVSRLIAATKNIEVVEKIGENRWLEKSKNIQVPDYITGLGVQIGTDGNLSAYLDIAGGVLIHSTIKPNTTYTISKENSNRFKVFELKKFVNVSGDKVLVNRLLFENDALNQATVTTSSDAMILMIYLSNASEKPFVQVEEGSVKTEWVTNGFKELQVSKQYPIANINPFLLLNPSDLDITAQLKSAFLQAQNSIVYINAGTYIFNETLTIPSNATIVGVGKVKLKLAPTHNLSFVNWRGANIRVLVKSDETSENIALKNIEVEGADTQDLERMHWGLCMQGYNHRLEDVNVKKINFIGGEATEVRAGGDGWGLVFYKAKKGRVIGGVFEGSGYENIGTNNAEDIVFDDIYSGPAWRTSFQVHRSCKNITLKNSTIEQTTISEAQTHAAITMHGLGSTKVEDVKIVDCTITATLGTGGKAAIQSVGGIEHTVKIRGNTINTNSNAIRSSTDALDIVEDWIVADNTINAEKQSVRIRGKNANVHSNIIKAQASVQFTGDDATTCVEVNNVFTPVL